MVVSGHHIPHVCPVLNPSFSPSAIDHCRWGIFICAHISIIYNMFSIMGLEKVIAQAQVQFRVLACRYDTIWPMGFQL